MNVALIGLGPHAKRIYFRYLKKHGIKLALLVDLASNKEAVRKYIKENNIDTKCLFVDDSEKDYPALSKTTSNELTGLIYALNITHAIIATEPKAHFAYANFFLENGVNILMDKPITAPIDVISSTNQAEKIRSEYEQLCDSYKKQKAYNENLIFSIQCQRRFHKGYIFVKSLLREIVQKYDIPVSYIDIFHSDGMWNMPDEFTYRENHPYKYGYGKLFHSGYHFIDLLTWLLEVNSQLKDGKQINRCSVYSESYRPADFMRNFNDSDYRNILKTDKFAEIIQNKAQFKDYGELDIHSIINFYHNNDVVTNCSLNLMQSGVSRRSWIDLPEDTYKSNGRIRHERLNIYVGPLFGIQVHSYQAYEAKERIKHGGHSAGDIEHFDIYIFRNTDIIAGKPFEKVSMADLYERTDDSFIGYNEEAREKCLADFINGTKNESDLFLHKQSILITEMICKSIIHEGRKMQSNFDIKSQDMLNQIATITDEDFGLAQIKQTDTPATRIGARGIVVNSRGEIAIIHKTAKNEYKLPGGGIDEGELAKNAFARECREELGCIVENIEEIGTVIEYKSQSNFKQLSFVFAATLGEQLESNNLTAKEKAEGTEYIWLPKIEALKRMQNSLKQLKASDYDSVYRTKFMVLRDIKILEHYINAK